MNPYRTQPDGYVPSTSTTYEACMILIPTAAYALLCLACYAVGVFWS